MPPRSPRSATAARAARLWRRVPLLGPRRPGGAEPVDLGAEARARDVAAAAEHAVELLRRADVGLRRQRRLGVRARDGRHGAEAEGDDGARGRRRLLGALVRLVELRDARRVRRAVVRELAPRVEALVAAELAHVRRLLGRREERPQVREGRVELDAGRARVLFVRDARREDARGRRLGDVRGAVQEVLHEPRAGDGGGRRVPRGALAPVEDRVPLDDPPLVIVARGHLALVAAVELHVRQPQGDGRLVPGDADAHGHGRDLQRRLGLVLARGPLLGRVEA